jgi:hypothetical protein
MLTKASARSKSRDLTVQTLSLWVQKVLMTWMCVRVLVCYGALCTQEVCDGGPLAWGVLAITAHKRISNFVIIYAGTDRYKLEGKEGDCPYLILYH